jgi:NAD(P)-dependent dehydrogenase (short-subunit alcohol dehydrogenase family)
MKFAAVTGAGSGIGRACALALARAGWRVALLGRREGALQETAAQAGEAAPRCLPIPCDVAEEAQVAAAFARIEAQFGRLDLLFNNAGIFMPTQTPDEVSGADWRRIVDANLSGSFYCLSRAFGLMRRQQPQGGRIINNGSISAYAPRPGSIGYTATKHAISGLTRAAALDGRAFDIAVGQIDIGNVASEMTERMAAGILQADGSVRAEARMDLDCVVDAFMTMAALPLSANMLFVNVMATRMPFVGRG